MNTFYRNLTLMFSAGALGGLAGSLALWLMGANGITAALEVRLSPALTPAWLYPRIVWGGIWGALFLLPLGGRSWPARGVLLSVLLTLIQLFIIFPLKTQKGLMGFNLGALTPLVVVTVNAVWGVCAGLWLTFIGARR